MSSALLVGGLLVTATSDPAQVQTSTYKQWSSYELRNRYISMHITPQLGGRILGYSLGGHEFLWSSDALAGQTPPPSGLAPDGSWLNWGGDKLWPAPQGWDGPDQWPGPPDAVLDGSPHALSTLPGGRAAIALASLPDQRSGVQLSREIELHSGGTHVSVSARMKNIGTTARRWGIWTVTQLDAAAPGNKGGWNTRFHTYAPLPEDGRYKVLFGDAQNTQFEKQGDRGLLHIHYARRVGKVGIHSTAGWLANVDGSTGHVFVQAFEYQPDATYPDDSTIEVWTQGLGTIHAWGREVAMEDDAVANPNLVESELLGPLTTLQPGEVAQFRYDWYAATLGGDLPVLTCNGVGCVSEAFTASLSGGQLCVAGRFGVFFAGEARLRLLDSSGREVRTAFRQAVSPLAPLVFAPGTALNQRVSKHVESVVVSIYDERGTLLGDLAQARIAEKPRGQ